MTGLARLRERILSWVHTRNFSPLTETRKSLRSLGLVLDAKFEKQNEHGGEVEKIHPSNQAEVFPWEKFPARFLRYQLSSQTTRLCEHDEIFFKLSRDVLRSRRPGNPGQPGSFEEAVKTIKQKT